MQPFPFFKELILCITTSLQSPASVEIVKERVKRFRQWFNDIKKSTINCLEKCKMAVTTVVFLLTSIKAVDEHRLFLEEKQKTLRKSEDHLELFGHLNLYWNYLNFDLLEQLIEVLNLERTEFDSVATEMAEYKKQLENFRRSTALELFCQAASSEPQSKIPTEFKEMVVKFEWPEDVTLENVEEFRQCYALTYDLTKCAMMVNTSIRRGSFMITWFLPEQAIEKLMKTRAPVDLFKEFSVTKLDINGSCFYRAPLKRKVSSIGHFTTYHTTCSIRK